RVAVDGAGQQDVELAELDRVEDPVERGADRHAAAALVGVVLLPGAVLERVVQLLPALRAARPADDDVVVLRLAEVHPRLVYAQLTLRRGGAFPAGRCTAPAHGGLPGSPAPRTH